MRSFLLALLATALGLASPARADGHFHGTLWLPVTEQTVECHTTDMHDGFFVSDAVLKLSPLGHGVVLPHPTVMAVVTRSSPERPEPCLQLDELVREAARHGGLAEARVDFSGCVSTLMSELGRRYDLYQEFLTVTFPNGLKLDTYDMDTDAMKHSLHCP